MAWSDGAHDGVSAGRALETILGGKETPKPEELQTQEQVRARVMSRPNPCEGPPIWKDAEDPFLSGLRAAKSGTDGSDPYTVATECITKAFLLVKAEQPDLPLEDGPLWAAIKAKWPGFNDWIGGASGFMVGWALNCVRWLNDLPEKQNPALLEVETK